MARAQRDSDVELVALENRIGRRPGCFALAGWGLLVATLAVGGAVGWRYFQRYDQMRLALDEVRYRGRETTERVAFEQRRARDAEQATAAARAELDRLRTALERRIEALGAERDQLRIQLGMAAATAGGDATSSAAAEALTGRVRAAIPPGASAQTEGARVTVTLADGALFRAGDAATTPTADAQFAQLGGVIRAAGDVDVTVEAVVDDAAARDARRFASAIDLASARAAAIARLLRTRGGLDGAHLAAVGRTARADGARATAPTALRLLLVPRAATTAPAAGAASAEAGASGARDGG